MQNRFKIMKNHLPHSTLRSSIRYCLFSIPAIAFCACTAVRPLHGGKAMSVPKPAGIAQKLVQTENPSQISRQEQETIKVRTYTFHPTLDTRPIAIRSLSERGLISEREETRAKTELGAAQKDTTRELKAKLSSLKGVVWAGLAMFVFGLASFFWAPLRVIIGSVTTSAAIALGGLALIIVPTLVVGHELLILGGVATVVGAWFLAHRHGRFHGEISTTRRFTPGNH